MRINVMVDEGCYFPVKAYPSDAGFDIKTPVSVTVKARQSVTVDTGVHMEIPHGYVGFFKSKSGLNVLHGIACEGVVDSGYTGSIVAKLINHSDEDYSFERGNKITQIVILPIPEVELDLVTKFKETKRGNSGFGSTGK